MTHHTTTTTPNQIDVIREPCPTARVFTMLSLALIEELDRLRGPVPRSSYLAQIIDAAMTREAPHLPDVAAGVEESDGRKGLKGADGIW